MVEQRYCLRKELNKVIAPQTRELFTSLTTKLRRETEHHTINRMFEHPCHQAILDMGEIAVPLLLERMATDPGHYFFALTQLTGIDPCVRNERFDQAVNRWLVWGYEEGYLDVLPTSRS